MATNFIPKQVNWLTRWQTAVVNLMTAVDAANALASEYATDAYGTGGANAITDLTVQTGTAQTGTTGGPMPAMTAVLVASAVGIINGSNQIQAQIGQGGTNRGYLENMRP